MLFCLTLKFHHQPGDLWLTLKSICYVVVFWFSHSKKLTKKTLPVNKSDELKQMVIIAMVTK